MHNMARSVSILAAGAAIAAASNTNSLGNAIDMDGYDGCLFLVPIEDSVATGVASASVEQCDTSGGSYAALDDDLATATCAVNDDINQKFLVVDVWKPKEQYLKLRRVSATANIAFGSAIAVRYGARNRPTALGDIVAAAALASPLSPAET